MTDPYYGEAPVDLGPLELPDWHEFMHYLYLPVRIPERDFPEPVTYPEPQFGLRPPAKRSDVRGEVRLAFLMDAVVMAMQDAAETAPHLADPYVYITARRGYATPGNPLNRPGWHCDDFGGTDLNYIWSDAYPTRVLLSENPLRVRARDDLSMDDMRFYADHALGMAGTGGRPGQKLRVADAPTGHLLRLSPYVIHDTPIIPEPGGMRSFFKISVSNHRYNLLGNSHNHLLDYDWPMHNRESLRNQPAGANSDYVDQTGGSQ